MRHGGGAHFAFHGALLEVAQGNVAPDVTIEVQQDGVETHQCVEVFGDAVVRFDLGGEGVEGEPQAFHKAACEGFPVHVWVGGQVGIVVPHGAIDFAEQFHGGELVALALQASDYVGHFLPHGGGGGGLTMGARQHRLVSLGVGLFADGADYLVHFRQQGFPRFAQHQGVGQVIDVLAGAGEMHELAHVGQFVMFCHLFLDEIFHRLHIVIGGGFDGLDALGMLRFEIASNAAQVPGGLATH